MIYMGCDDISVLIVEDSAEDEALLLSELKRKLNVLRHKCVCSREDFLTALKAEVWDAVISDHALPEFSGPEALRLLRQQGLETPFIMVSGVYGEEEAVNAMKAGANDYVTKGHLTRLSPALERELLAVQERCKRIRAEKAMQFLAAIVESSTDAIFGMNRDGLIVSWNSSAERLFGYNAEEIVGRSSALLYPQHRRDELLGIQAGVLRGDIVGVLETERLHKSGEIFPVAVTFSPIKHNAGEIIGASSITRDMARQREAEADHLQLIQELLVASK